MSNTVAMFLGGIIFVCVVFTAMILDGHGDNRVKLAHIEAGHVQCMIMESDYIQWTIPQLCIGTPIRGGIDG